MVMELLELLDIKKSELTGNDEDNFRKLKKAYYKAALKHHPDRTKSEESERLFKEISTAWTNSEITDVASCATFLRGVRPGAFFKATAADFPEANFQTTNLPTQGSGDSLRVKREGVFTIHIPVPVVAPEKMKERSRFYTIGDSGPEFHFSKLTAYINAMSKRNNLQVGISQSEANEIINQHSHRTNYMIVAVEVDINRLSDSKLSEKDTNPGMLNANSGKYFYLLKDTTIKLEDIHSVSTKVGFLNTRRQGFCSDLQAMLGLHRIGNPGNAKAIKAAQRELHRLTQGASERLALEAARHAVQSTENEEEPGSRFRLQEKVNVNVKLNPKVDLAIRIIESEFSRVEDKLTTSSYQQSRREQRKNELERIVAQLKKLRGYPPSKVNGDIATQAAKLRNTKSSRSLLRIADTLNYLSAEDYKVNQAEPEQQLVELLCNKLLSSHQAQSSKFKFSLSKFFSSTYTLSGDQFQKLRKLKENDYDISTAKELFDDLKPASKSKFPSEIDVLATLASTLLSSTAHPTDG